MSWGVLPWVYPVWDSLGFLDLGGYFLPHFMEVFSYYLLKYFLMVFLSSSSGTPMIRMLGCLTLSQRSLRLSSFLLIIFSSLFYLFLAFYLLPQLSYFLPPLFYCWFPPECFLSHLLHYSLYIDSFLFLSRYLLKLSCLFSILVSRLFICNSNLFSRFWILFTLIFWNSLSGRFPISSSFVWFVGHLSCSYTC